MQLDVLDLLAQVRCTGPDVVRILFEHLRRQRAAGDHAIAARVHFQRADRGNDHRRVGREARRATFDVEEALRAHVGAEPGLGYQKVAAVNADEVRDDRRVAGGDVAERTRVHQHRRVLERLQQVGLDGVAHDHGHRAGGEDVLRADRLATCCVADDDAAEALAHVSQ